MNQKRHREWKMTTKLTSGVLEHIDQENRMREGIIADNMQWNGQYKMKN